MLKWNNDCQNVFIWTLIFLSQHPRIARELLDVLRENLRGASPTLKNVAELPLLDAVIKESLRILPRVPIQMRVAHQDTYLVGYPLSKGARVILNAFPTNRRPDPYPEADSFLSDRWSSIHPTAFE
jgi:cytochrome P450